MSIIWLLIAITIVPNEDIPFVAFESRSQCERVSEALNRHPQRSSHCQKVEVVTHNKKENKRGKSAGGAVPSR